jgi:hypothetical protein
VRRSIYFRSLIDTRTVPYPSTNNRYLEKRCYALSYISKYRKQSTYDLINRTTNQLQQHLALHSNYIKIMKLLCRAKAIAIYGPFCKRYFAILYLKRYRLILVKKKTPQTLFVLCSSSSQLNRDCWQKDQFPQSIK